MIYTQDEKNRIYSFVPAPDPPCGYWIIQDGMTLWACYKQPNWWLQFWHKALLGWSYETDEEHGI